MVKDAVLKVYPSAPYDLAKQDLSEWKGDLRGRRF